MSVLRPITTEDHAAVLAWNAADVELLAPLTGDRLIELLGWSDAGSIVVHEGRAVGFVLTFAAGSAYDSPNFRWFADRHAEFLYLDRIVIDPAVRRAGLGTLVYDAIETRARELGPALCLEVNLDPPNEPSLAFHRRRGFAEVGRLQFGDHLLTMMEKPLRDTIREWPA